MDLELTKKIFFQRINYKKEHSFDSYSQGIDDIIYHYHKKYEELPFIYKRSKPLSLKDLINISKKVGDSDCVNLINEFNINSPFELYIIAFIAGFQGYNLKSIEYFEICSKILDNSTPSAINKIFIQLQIAQLYEREKEYKLSFSILFNVYKVISANCVLMNCINNFFASCCVSLGLLCCQQFSKKSLAGALFLHSTLVRLKYQKNYSHSVFNNYISIVYRYMSSVYYARNLDQYITLKESYCIRYTLLQTTNDNFTKEEFSYLSFDFIRLLINNSYKISLVNKIANRLYKNISVLHYSSQNKLSSEILKIAVVLSKYYYYNNNILCFIKWYSMAKYFLSKFQIEQDIHFLNSEDIFCYLKK